jgi:hypothetical protein
MARISRIKKVEIKISSIKIDYEVVANILLLKND